MGLLLKSQGFNLRRYKYRYSTYRALSGGSPRAIAIGLAAILPLGVMTTPLRADPSLQELAKEIAALKAENREMKKTINQMHGETRATQEKVRLVAKHPTAYPAPLPNATIPPGATPAFVTADKKLMFGGITLTPGGFLAGETLFRSKTTNSDINSAWNNIPYNNSSLARLNETRLTGRQSQAKLLAEGYVTPSILASGYAEFDFLGSGTTSNATDTNSYAPRIRQLYAAVDWNDIGLHFMAGQMWSLSTLNSKGITPRNEVVPPVIDGQALPGFIFARQAGVRLTKDFDKNLWFSLALEEAQTTFPAGATAACQGTAITAAPGAAPVAVAAGAGITAVCAATGSGAGFSQYGQPYSLNHLPDIIGKVAYEARFADRDVHLEAMGMYKDLYNASYLTATPTNFSTHDVAGYGVGGGLVFPILPKLLDFQGSAMVGRGIGRYGAGLLPDSTLNPDGSLRPIGEVIGMAGLTLHATPELDIYAFGGLERQNPAYSYVGGASSYFGYGVPNADNSGCNVLGGTCSGQTHTLWQLTGGFWYKAYGGNFGEVRLGAQYSYTERDAFTTQASPTAPVYSAKTDEHTVMTSVRYYPFAAPPAAPALAAKY